ncbi:hypothetical protein AYI68_g7699 [Smittium mucronatum]|uniref:Uncharacterized protein n=1 Tax=Smittium mucronatum TaxID=133383 RepID=A0A1R0GMY4_9FUNG|nr:hypothetical protein AYI68_g7699 [Smittium mucronatum]
MANPEPNVTSRISWLGKSTKTKEYSYPLIFNNFSGSRAQMTVQYTVPKVVDTDTIHIETKLTAFIQPGPLNKMLGLSASELVVDKAEDRTHTDGVVKWDLELDIDEQQIATLTMIVTCPTDFKIIGL